MRNENCCIFNRPPGNYPGKIKSPHMHSDIDMINANFRRAASTVFLSLYEQFKNAVKDLDRQKDENVFRQLQSRYADELKRKLTEIAIGLLDRYKGPGDTNTLRRELTNQVSYYQTEFILKEQLG